jgi:hypothetical protein
MSIVLLRKETMNKLIVDLLQQKGLGCWKVLRKGVNRKEKCFLSSQTRWSWQNKRACTSCTLIKEKKAYHARLMAVTICVIWLVGFSVGVVLPCLVQ